MLKYEDVIEYIEKNKIRCSKRRLYIENAIKHNPNYTVTKIIEFVKGSNSKVGASYYICRGIENYADEQEKYKTKFIKSAYTDASREKTASNINRKTGNSFGYCGYTETMPNGKKYYCRSTPEYIFVHYFFKEYNFNEFTLEYEKQIYRFGNFNYKPDFFIYDLDRNLIKIVEIKSDNRFLNDERYSIIKEYFKKINIEYEVKFDFKSFIRKYKLQSHIDKWKQNCDPSKNNTAGELNGKYCGKTDNEIYEIAKRELLKLDNTVIQNSHYCQIAEKFNLPKYFSKFRKISIKEIIDEVNEINGYPKFKNWQERREFVKRIKNANTNN